MAANTSIEWADHTVNLWKGCTKCAPGCANCYAAAQAKRLGEGWGPSAPRIYCKGAHETLRKLNRRAAKRGVIETVFINSHSDFFEDFEGLVVDFTGEVMRHCSACGWRGTPPIIVPALAKRMNIYGCPDCDTDVNMREVTVRDLRRDAFPLFGELTNLVFILVTKRPENSRRMWSCVGNDKDPGAADYLRFDNVILLTSVSEQETLERNADELVKCHDLAGAIGLSAEPLLGPLNFTFINARMLDWVIAGGESGPGARPCNVAWIESLIDQCRGASVPCFVKQLGSCPVAAPVPGYTTGLAKLKDKKGGDWEEWPEDLRVREFPSLPAKT